jgi:hypothetical protein
MSWVAVRPMLRRIHPYLAHMQVCRHGTENQYPTILEGPDIAHQYVVDFSEENPLMPLTLISRTMSGRSHRFGAMLKLFDHHLPKYATSTRSAITKREDRPSDSVITGP